PRRAAEKTCLQASDAHRAVRNGQGIVSALDLAIARHRVFCPEADNPTEAVFTAGCRDRRGECGAQKFESLNTTERMVLMRPHGAGLEVNEPAVLREPNAPCDRD